ncbi:MAG TPA: hypothetical protein IAB97_02830 [Candidatus Choladousia intestinipullorum]|nr:hypothetical protein [Candidatus Choladousia intestinipullorum]
MKNMHSKRVLLLLGLIAAVSAAGCGNQADDNPETELSTSAPEASADEDAVIAEEETSSQTEASLDPITPSDYLVKDVSDYVTLGEITGIPVTQYTYEITDDMVQERVDLEVSAYDEEIEVDRASQEGDVVYIDLTSTVGGDAESEYTESTYITLGDEEYGAEFDQELLGASAGDTLEFSITFGDDIWMEDWMGQTVDFSVDVTSVCEIQSPEYNDTFVSENTEYSTTEEFESALRDTLADEYAETSLMDTVESLFQAVESEAVFAGYPQELYDLCKEETLSFYAAFAGTSDEQEIYDLFGLTEDDMDAEVLTTVNRRLIVSSICEQAGLEVTEEEYTSYVTDYAEYYGYDSAADFEADNTRETLVWSLYETKAGDYLYENADITEEPYSEDEDLSLEDFEIELEAEEDTETAATEET